MEIDTHLGCAMSGLTADARTMIDHARVTSQNHAFTYNEPIKVESVTQAVCDLALRFGESVHDEDAMMSRPFGVALLIAGIDEKGPQLCVKPFFCFGRLDGMVAMIYMIWAMQVPHGPIRDIHPVRGKGYRIWIGSRTKRTSR